MESERRPSPEPSGPASFRRPALAAVWIAIAIGAALWPVAMHFLGGRLG